jgi:hypothetical protein
MTEEERTEEDASPEFFPSDEPAKSTIVDMVEAAMDGGLSYDDLAGLNALASGRLKEAMKKAESDDLALIHDLIRKHKFAYTDVRTAFATRHTKRDTKWCPLCKSKENWATIKGSTKDESTEEGKKEAEKAD